MDSILKHYLNILLDVSKNDFPSFPISECRVKDATFRAITPLLLYHYLIIVKEMYPEALPSAFEKFWANVGKCFQGALLPNLHVFQTTGPDVQAEAIDDPKYPTMHYNSTQILSKGVKLVDIESNFAPLVVQACEILTHLITPFYNPRGERSKPETDFSISDAVKQSTQAVMALVEEPRRRQVGFKTLCLRRDGEKCVLTDIAFSLRPDTDRQYTKFIKPSSSQPSGGVVNIRPKKAHEAPILCHIIPHSTMKGGNRTSFIANIEMFAGCELAKKVAAGVDTVGNTFNAVQSAQKSFDALRWSMFYVPEDKSYRYVLLDSMKSPGVPQRATHEKLNFGQGTARAGDGLGAGPDPEFVNLQYAIASLARLSGAAEYLEHLYDRQLLVDADPAELPEQWFARALDLKLTWLKIKSH